MSNIAMPDIFVLIANTLLLISLIRRGPFWQARESLRIMMYVLVGATYILAGSSFLLG